MIHPSFFTLAILLMAMITFAVRYVFFTTSFQLRLHPKIKSLLRFTAPCILTAMLIPIVFKDMIARQTILALIDSSYFWAGMATVVFSLLIRNTLIVIILSMSVFYGLRLLGSI